jgi:hypothetical protein
VHAALAPLIDKRYYRLTIISSIDTEANMHTYRPTRVVKVVTGVLSVMYFGAWALAALLLIVLAGAELFAGPDALRDFELGAPGTVELADVELASTWAGRTGTITLEEARASLNVPLSLAPRWYRAAMYIGVAVTLGLVLLFLHHLRQLFLRVRAGAPFDAHNATRLRWMAGALLGGHVITAALSVWLSRIALATVADKPSSMAWSFPLDSKVLVVALLLFALAEIFRRGAVLEDEQSLVV